MRSGSDHRYGFEFMELNPAQREIISKTCKTLALLQRTVSESIADGTSGPLTSAVASDKLYRL